MSQIAGHFGAIAASPFSPGDYAAKLAIRAAGSIRAALLSVVPPVEDNRKKARVITSI